MWADGYAPDASEIEMPITDKGQGEFTRKRTGDLKSVKGIADIRRGKIHVIVRINFDVRKSSGGGEGSMGWILEFVIENTGIEDEAKRPILFLDEKNPKAPFLPTGRSQEIIPASSNLLTNSE